eukprot:2297336-Prymnesium_polylepis.1
MTAKACTCCAAVQIAEPYVLDRTSDAEIRDGLALIAAINERLRKAKRPERLPFASLQPLKYKKLAPPCLHQFYLTANELRQKRSREAFPSYLQGQEHTAEQPSLPVPETA